MYKDVYEDNYIDNMYIDIHNDWCIIRQYSYH